MTIDDHKPAFEGVGPVERRVTIQPNDPTKGKRVLLLEIDDDAPVIEIIDNLQKLYDCKVTTIE